MLSSRLISCLRQLAAIATAFLVLVVATFNSAWSAERQLPPGSIQAPALVYWASLGRTATVKSLLEQKADPNSVDEGGWSALQAAAENGHLEIVKMLVDAGASLSYRSEGGTALELAAKSNRQLVVDYLRSRGAK